MKRIFLPDEFEKQVRGWLLHCHKGRDRHDVAARWFDCRHQRIVWASALLAALAGVTLAADADTLTTTLIGWPGADDLARVLIGVLGVVSAFLIGYQRAMALGERAEAHRQKAEAYKALIWDIEQNYRATSEVDRNNLSDKWRAEFESIEKMQGILPSWIAEEIDRRKYPSVDFFPDIRTVTAGVPEQASGSSPSLMRLFTCRPRDLTGRVHAEERTQQAKDQLEA